MQNRHISGLVGGKSINPSAVTCPNCGHLLASLRKTPRSGKRQTSPRRDRTPARFVLQVFRGSLIWFAIVFVLVGTLAGAVGQNMWPTLFGIGLLAVYGTTYLLAARYPSS